MENLRADLIMRAESERQASAAAASDRPHAAAEPSVERHEQGSGPRRTGRYQASLDTLPTADEHERHDQEPKSPDLEPRRLTMSSSRYTELRYPREHMLLPPEPVATPRLGVQHEGTPLIQLTPFNSTEHTEPSPVNADESFQNVTPDRQGDDESGGRRPRPKRFLFCFPWIKSQRIRSQVLTCLLSGIFFCILLAIYLGLTLTKNIRQSELTIMIVLVIITAAIFFSYSAVRLCLLVFWPERELGRREGMTNILGPGGYAMPPKPIPVVLAQDEEAAGIQGEAAKSRPPAYGLWRESVRLDPNRLFWQRADDTPPRSETRTGPRPPSYASDDGVSYVVEARPRSMAPPPEADVSIYSSVPGRRTERPLTPPPMRELHR